MDPLADIDASSELDAQARARVLAFLQATSLPGPAWPAFKRLVRQLERGVENGVNESCLGEALRRLDEQPFDATSRTFWPALGYWKRRGRRFLRKLARASPPCHDDVARALLDSVCAGEGSLPSHAWISLDLLFGKPRDTSGRGVARRRIAQRRHGRGPVEIICRIPAKRSVLEDRLQAADATFQSWLEGIASEASRPWEVIEMAVRRLRHAGVTLRPSPAFIVRAAHSESHLLRRVAAEHVASLETVQGDAADELQWPFDLATHVRLITGVGSRTRRRLEPAFVRRFAVAGEASASAILEQIESTLFLDHPPKPIRFLIGLLAGPLRAVLPGDLSARARDFFGTDLAVLLTVPGATPSLLGKMRRHLGGTQGVLIREHLDGDAMSNDGAARWMLKGRLTSIAPSLDELRGRAVTIRRRPILGDEQRARLVKAASESEAARRKALLLCQGDAHLQVAGADVRARAAADASLGEMLALFNRSVVIGRAGREARSVALLRQAMTIDGLHGWVANNLSWALATTRKAKIRNPPEAVVQATAACTASGWRVGSHWDTLAAALAASGRYSEAVVAAETAMHLDPTLTTADGTPVVESFRRGRLHPRDELFVAHDTPSDAGGETLIPAQRGSKWGYVRKADPATFAIPPRFDEARPFRAGVAAVGVGKRQGLIDDTGRFLVDPVYESIGPFIDGLAVAVTNAGEVLIDHRGRAVTRPHRPQFVGFTRGGSGADFDTLVASGAVDSPEFARATTPPPASEVGFAAMHSCQPAAFAAWLDAVCLSPTVCRDRAVAILERRAADVEFDTPEILAMVSHASAWVRNAGWRLVRRSATDTAVLESVWQQVADRGGSWQLDSDEAMALIAESADIAEVAAGLLAEDPPTLLAALGDDRDDRRRLARVALRRMRNTAFRNLVDLVGRMEAGDGARAFDAIETGLRGGMLPWGRVRPLVVHVCEEIRLRGWRLAAASDRASDFAAAAVKSVAGWKTGSAAWSTARDSGDAIDILMAGGLAAAAPAKAAELVEAWKTGPRAACLGLDSLVRLAASDDAAWQAFRGELLSRARGGGEGFWKACLAGEAAAGIAGRIVADPEFVEAFSSVDASWPARITATPAAPLLRAWLERHGERVAGDPAVLVSLAASVESAVRSMAMELLDRAFVDPATLGRLVETGHPECESLARRILDRYERPTFDEAVVLLWDSAAAAGRRLALELLLAHRLPVDRDLLARLIETRDPDLLAGLARFMDEHAPSGDLRRRYDAAVLRSPWLGRPAKEAVKRRALQPGAEPVDPSTLAALADAPAVADREWAIARLVEAAARGEAVDGLTIVRESSS